MITSSDPRATATSFFAEVGEPASSRTLPPPSDQPSDFERIIRVAAEHGMNI
jgi:hypothetical protein